jgi:hypothetical protein
LFSLDDRAHVFLGTLSLPQALQGMRANARRNVRLAEIPSIQALFDQASQFIYSQGSNAFDSRHHHFDAMGHGHA